ncbi:MAG TPA: DUF308 domain-containing protein [Streptosporangiaceae bacterium]|nr:DUF308 domain-containing protein [Streptosporangiaceae bacterium]
MPSDDSGTDFAVAYAWQATLVLGIVTLVLGLILAFYPSVTVNVIAVMLGLLAIVSGLFHLIRMFGHSEGHRVWMGISGLLLVVAGVVLLRHLHLTVALIGLIIGLGWIVQGVTALVVSLSGEAREGRGWWIFFGIISLVGGIVITSLPAESVTLLAALTGIWFIVQGVFEIAGGLMLRRATGREQAAVTGPPARPSEGAATL